MRYREAREQHSTQGGQVVLTQLPAASAASRLQAADPAWLHGLWVTAEAESCGLSLNEFATALDTIGAKLNFGLPAGERPGPAQIQSFCEALRLPEFALAQACALGRERAWARFLETYRARLTQAAIAIAGSATLGHDLADSLYAELYGLRQTGTARRSPLLSYSGRGSLLGWLRTTLAQRHVDHHRRTHRESPLEGVDAPAHPAPPAPSATELHRVGQAVALTLRTLPAEDRFLLASYFLDRRTLLEISRTLQVHEATISRRLKRLTGSLREQLLGNLQAGGLSKRAAEESLGTDPRDLEINLRKLLQVSASPPFQDHQEPPDSRS